MTTPQDAIPDKISDILKADSDFDDINLFLVGLGWVIQAQDYPVCNIVVLNSVTTQELTGNARVREYNGILAFDIIIQDNYVKVDRQATMPSTLQMNAFVNAAVNLLQNNTNKTLGHLVVDNGRVEELFIGEDLITYSPEQRDNLWLVSAEIPWTCRTREVMT